jgi:Flp pilus assembly protein TadG
MSRALSTRSAGRSTRRRRGAATVEFASVAPLFFLLLAGIIEFGQAFRIKHALSNASRRGARAAIVDAATNQGVESALRGQCVNTLGVDAADVTIRIEVNGSDATPLSAADVGDEIGVTVSVPYAKAGVGFYANLFSNSVMESKCTLEHE